MSKDKPEIGDVWELNNGSIFHYKYYILETRPWSDYIDVISNSMVKSQKNRNFFKDCIYLGKSKASIEQLFEVENEDVMV